MRRLRPKAQATTVNYAFYMSSTYGKEIRLDILLNHVLSKTFIKNVLFGKYNFSFDHYAYLYSGSGKISPSAYE
jgi:hypothetical protein